MSAHSEAANGFVISEKALLMLNVLPEAARRDVIGRAYERFFGIEGSPLESDAEERGAEIVAEYATEIASKFRKRQEQSRSARAVGISRLSRDGRESGPKESGEESTPPVPPTKEEGKEKNILSAPARTRKVFVPPTADEVRAYCAERGNGIDADDFVDFYTGKGWFVGKNKMVDWKAAVRTWERGRDNAGNRSGLRGCGGYAGARPQQAGSWKSGTDAQRSEASAVL